MSPLQPTRISLTALRERHDYFHENGCRISDHGLEQPYGEDFTDREIEDIFARFAAAKRSMKLQIRQFKTAILLDLARMDAEKNWTQQFHFGALRNTNDRGDAKLGPDTGYDSIGDFEIGKAAGSFFQYTFHRGKSC